MRPHHLVALAATALLGGCAATTAADTPSLTVTDAWVKTAQPEDLMSAAFGVIENTTDEDITIVAATSDALPRLELHEVVDGAMQQLGDGMTVPAHGELTLEPGGFHIMVMELPEAIDAGERLAITLELEDGSSVDFTATAKDFDGGNEEYHDADMDMDESMEHSDG